MSELSNDLATMQLIEVLQRVYARGAIDAQPFLASGMRKYPTGTEEFLIDLAREAAEIVHGALMEEIQDLAEENLNKGIF